MTILPTTRRTPSSASSPPTPATTTGGSSSFFSDAETVSTSTQTLDSTEQLGEAPATPSLSTSALFPATLSTAAAQAAAEAREGGAGSPDRGGGDDAAATVDIEIGRGSYTDTPTHTQTPSRQQQKQEKNEETKDNEEDEKQTHTNKGAPGSPSFTIASTKKARSLPTVLKSSYRGDWRLFLRRVTRGSAHPSHSSHDPLDEDDIDSPPAPPSISVLSSFHSTVSSTFQRIERRFHQMPKYQYRLMVASIIFLLVSLGLLLIVTVMYGFGMSLPHVEVTKIEVVTPLPADGSIPIKALIRFNNPNSFSVRVHPTTITVHTLPGKDPNTQLSVADMEGQYMSPRDSDHSTEVIFYIKNVNTIEGGPDVLKSVLTGKSTYLYTHTLATLTVKSLGFMSINRKFRLECTILKHWGENLMLSDCWGRFQKK